jgi:hypothetical protein
MKILNVFVLTLKILAAMILLSVQFFIKNLFAFSNEIRVEI